MKITILWCVAMLGCSALAVETMPLHGPQPIGAKDVHAATYVNLSEPDCGLQAAIDAAGPNGGVVLIPPGVFPLKRALILRSNVTLRGSGASTVLRKETVPRCALTSNMASGTTEVAVSDSSAFCVGQEVGVVDFKFFMWNSTHTFVRDVQKGRLVLEAPAKWDYTRYYSAWVVGLHPAIYADSQTNVAIENIAIEALEPARLTRQDFDFSAIHLVSCCQVRIRNVSITGWPADGISVQRGSNVMVTACTVTRSLGNGMHPGTMLHDAVFADNVSSSNSWDGLFFCVGNKHVMVSNNVFRGNGRSGIGDLGCGDDELNVCMGNKCLDNGWSGIYMNGYRGFDGRNNSVISNVCMNNSRAQAGKYPGILIENTRDSVVAGNRCGDDQKTPTQLIGILETGRSDRNLISSNQVACVGPGTNTIVKIGPHTRTEGNTITARYIRTP